MKTNFDPGFSSSTLLRTPAFPVSGAGSSMQELLDDPYFRAAILVASKSLYQTLEKADFDYTKLNERTRFSLWKYHNRMCYRTTSFGLFATVAIIPWGTADRRIEIDEGRLIHRRHSYVGSLQQALRIAPAPLKVTANKTLYKVGREYRFLRYHLNAKNDRVFSVGSVELTGELGEVVRYCSSERATDDLSKFIRKTFDVPEEDALEFIGSLISEGVLCSNTEPNITGTDYLQRLAAGSAFRADSVTRNPLELAADYARHYASQLSGIEPPFYINASRKVLSGTLDERLKDKILSGIHCATRLSPPFRAQSLDRYATAFREKYDRQWVPLLTALDPELGIAYQSLGATHDDAFLLQDMNIKEVSQKKSEVNWTEVHTLLLRKYGEAMRGGTGIELTDHDLDGITPGDHDLPVAPSVYVVYQQYGDKVIIEQAGGLTGLNMTGRFSILSRQIHQLGKEIAQSEMAANPGVVFAELACIGEGHAANIERREHFFSYEIPVLTVSERPGEEQIALSDLWLHLRGDEFILWSAKLQKRIIPRLSSPYNYQRSELAVFRFLGDLQFQGVRTNLGFVIKKYFPELSHFPRVTYKDAILSPATWKISKAEIAAITRYKETEQKLQAFEELREQLQLPQRITVNEHDNYLVFDLDNPADQYRLVQHMQQPEEIIFKEFLCDDLAVHDQRRQTYVHQFISVLYNKNPVYLTRPDHLPPERTTAERKFIPGSDWFYFKVYCHPSRSDSILLEHVMPFIQSLGKDDGDFFFVRFYDPQYHLRIRIRFKGTIPGNMFPAFHTHFSKLLTMGIISRFTIDVYERELERYDPEAIHLAESFFCAGSQIITDLLMLQRQCNRPLLREQFAIETLCFMIEHSTLPAEKHERSFRFLYESMRSEFEQHPVFEEQLKQKYRDLKKAGLFPGDNTAPVTANKAFGRSYPAFKSAFSELMENIRHWHSAKQVRLIVDVIHMHLNRLFTESQRRQEIVMYFCLSNYYYSKQARERSTNKILATT